MATETRRILVEPLARVEGDGALTVHVREDGTVDVRLKILEPSRFFESLLVGRPYVDAPDVTARICGICPVAHQLTAIMALEDLFGVEVPQPLQDLRHVAYLGEWIESHALHVCLLHAPDFLGYADALQMGQDHPEALHRARRLKKLGKELTALVGGRGVHPINLRIGGFFDSPRPDEVEPVLQRVREAHADAMDLLHWVSGFRFPEFEQVCEYVALRGDRLVSDGGLDISPRDYERHFAQAQVSHSTALHSRLRARGSYAVGPLARYCTNSGTLPDHLRVLGPLCRNPFQSILVRAIEIVTCLEEAARTLEAYRVPEVPCVPHTLRPGTGAACTEAPRGLLYHRYTVGEDGRIAGVALIPPTAQNQPTIESDLRRLVAARRGLDQERLTWLCEQAIRNYDPCISCATH